MSRGIFNLLTSRGGGGGTPFNPEVTEVTYSQAATLIGNSDLKPSQVYRITDATAANGGRGSVTLIASSPNNFFAQGEWEFDTFNPSFGGIRAIWTSGQRKLVANGVDLAPYRNYASSQAASITAYVADINANSGTTGYRAVLQTPADNTNVGFNFAVVRTDGTPVTGTLLWTSDGSTNNALTTENVAFGVAPVIKRFTCEYNFDANQIYKVEDDLQNTVIVSQTYINSLGYNPIYFHPFGFKIVNISIGVTLADFARRSIFNNATFRNAVFFQARISNTFLFLGCNIYNANFENKIIRGFSAQGLVANTWIPFGGSILSSTYQVDYCNYNDALYTNWNINAALRHDYARIIDDKRTGITNLVTANEIGNNSYVNNRRTVNRGNASLADYSLGSIIGETYNTVSNPTGGLQNYCPNINITPAERLYPVTRSMTNTVIGTVTQLNIMSGGYLVEFQVRGVGLAGAGASLRVFISDGTNTVNLIPTTLVTSLNAINGISIPVTPTLFTANAQISYEVTGATITTGTIVTYLKMRTL